MNTTLASIPNAIETGEGLPRPNWSAISDWVDSNVTESDLNDAWTQLARDWLDALVHAICDGHTLNESTEFMLVSNGDSRSVDRILSWCEGSRRIILDTLAGVARDEGHGKHVVLAFADTDRYYDYVSDFHPDGGEFALSGGMFLDRGYGHFAMCLAYGEEHERTIAHELNHALLRHLPLPLWLNEGVTQVIEDIVVGSSLFMVDHETVHRHRDYWNSDTIHSFWSGDSFFSPDDGQELSYHLSQILFRNLMSDYPKQVCEFLNAADYLDAGNSALLDVCGDSLCDRVEQFLGDGDWGPRADYAEIDA